MKDQAGRGSVLDLTWPGPLINKSSVTILQPDMTWVVFPVISISLGGA